MINALLFVNADLGSSIALRYARELSNQIDLRLHGIHVIDPKRLGHAPGSGWVRKTWENALIETEKEEIKRFLDVEKTDLPFLKIPKVLIGDRTDKLLDELHNGQYHLFIEGVPPTTDLADFHKLINSRLYRMLPCPVLVVKNLLTPSKAAVLLDEHTDFKRFASSFSKIFNNSKIAVDRIYLKFCKSKDLVFREADAVDIPVENFEQHHFTASGMAKVIEGSPKTIAQYLRDYGVVASFANPVPRKNDLMLELLSRVSSPVLVCR